MTQTIDATAADRALKTKHRGMWALGDYPTLAADLISELGPRLVDACGVRPGERVLDVAAGSGNAAIPAALAGANVIASDLTPELFDAGRHEAARRGAELEWLEADAEALPFADELRHHRRHRARHRAGRLGAPRRRGLPVRWADGRCPQRRSAGRLRHRDARRAGHTRPWQLAAAAVGGGA